MNILKWEHELITKRKSMFNNSKYICHGSDVNQLNIKAMSG